MYFQTSSTALSGRNFVRSIYMLIEWWQSLYVYWGICCKTGKELLLSCFLFLSTGWRNVTKGINLEKKDQVIAFCYSYLSVEIKPNPIIRFFLTLLLKILHFRLCWNKWQCWWVLESVFHWPCSPVLSRIELNFLFLFPSSVAYWIINFNSSQFWWQEMLTTNVLGYL